MGKSRSFLPILIPSATVFLSSGCIMILEIVAGRLIARHLGSSLYTWTSVIGVVLAGIAIGNYLGGGVADRFPAKKALAVLFGICSVTCVAIVMLNNLVGKWTLLWYLSWPVRVFTHVSLVFLIPSTLLGTISPVVAKMALDQGLPTGRTVGDIYAWGAAGSIAGTLLAGFYLIASMGTIAIIWTVGAVLLLMAISYWIRLWLLYIWAVIFIILMSLGMAPFNWAKSASPYIALRDKPDPSVIYEDESQYCYIAVRQLSSRPDRRVFMQDKLIHSEIVMDDVLDLRYFYGQIYAAVTHRFSKGKDKLSVLVIGGGGYVFPRYVEKLWPGSRVDVAEIDPGVTEAAIKAFGLVRETSISTISMDARNYIEELLESEQTRGEKIRYDFIYEDALNDYSVPYQLTTKEFNDKVVKLLTDDGIYMIVLIDTFDSGLFLGAVINTLEKTFPHVYVVTVAKQPRSERNNFVIVAAMRQLNLANLEADYKKKKLDLWLFSESDIEVVKEKARQVVLTDNYAPVENLLAPVVRRDAIEVLVNKYQDEADKLRRQGKFDKVIAKYEKIIRIDPTMSVEMYNDIAIIQFEQGKLKDAEKNLKKALEFNEQSATKRSMGTIHLNLAAVLQGLNQPKQAADHFVKAAQAFRQDLVKTPTSVSLWAQLGDTLAMTGDFDGAAKAFKKALTLDPTNMLYYASLIRALMFQDRYEEAIRELRAGIQLMSARGRKDDVIKLRKFLASVELKKSGRKK